MERPKLTLTLDLKGEENDLPANGEIKILGISEDKMGKISDGYHTFEELYDHRITLYIALCRMRETYETAFNTFSKRGRVWRSKKHGDGKESYPGWFIMGIGREEGTQISYHIPLARWDETGFAETLERAPEWDGHTSGDVLERLKRL